MNIQTRKRQKGFTLTEALVAFGITATGLLAVASFQGDLISDSAYNKARTEALALAEQKLEDFKHYTLAEEDSYIDADGDGVMDPDGTYSEPSTIVGQNAVFTRSWDITSTAQGKQIDVTVSWRDTADVEQTVFLGSSVPWVLPRGGADQINNIDSPLLKSPTGRAELGEGYLPTDYPSIDPVTDVVYTYASEGLKSYADGENLLLVDSLQRVLLTLLDVCDTTTGSCTDFVKISGRVYMDTSNTPRNMEVADIFVVSSDAAHCQRWLPTGYTLASPPSTATGDYDYYNYTCYLGGGWHGNIGFVTASGVSQSDKVCQGDPTSLLSYEEPVIALRRTYRGMIFKLVNGVAYYESQGIKDAAIINDQDFVFTNLPVTQTEGSYCEGADGPMTRTDSNNGTLFTDVPTDFVCLNHDDNGDGYPDYLDSYDTSIYSAYTSCPFDPTDPPVQSHAIGGTIAILGTAGLDLSAFDVTTSDGDGNCTLGAFTSTTRLDGSELYTSAYSCTVFDWGTGWTGYVQLEPNSNDIFCPGNTTQYTDVTSDPAANIYICEATSTITIEGKISYTDNTDPISLIEIVDVSNPLADSYCVVLDGIYRCLLKYSGVATNVELHVTSSNVVCNSSSGVITFLNATGSAGAIRRDIYIAQRNGQCP